MNLNLLAVVELLQVRFILFTLGTNTSTLSSDLFEQNQHGVVKVVQVKLRPSMGFKLLPIQMSVLLYAHCQSLVTCPAI